MMNRLVRMVTIAVACALVGGALDLSAEQLPPRDIWPQATNAADGGDIDGAIKQNNALIDTGKSYGIKTYPLYAVSAAALAWQTQKSGNKDISAWARKTADQLDPTSAAVSFTNAESDIDQKRWSSALTLIFRGFARILTNYRTLLLARCDLLVVVALAIVLTTAIFSVSLFLRYGRSMGHDFREILSRSLHGGSVSVLAFALLFLPVFLWLGPVWLVFYWFIIFFSYAGAAERAMIIVLSLLVAVLPIVLDLSAHWIAGVDSPVVISAIASAEQSYHPEVLRRMQELAAIVPDNSTLQLLLGNLQLQEGNESQAAVHYRRSVELSESAGAHVNLGNLHFLDNDFAAANTEYEKAEQLDPKLAIAFYNNSVASGEQYKFDEQGQRLEQAKRLDRARIERLSSSPPLQKIVIYYPPIPEAWSVAAAIGRKGNARSLFGNYSYFDPQVSAVNPVTVGAILTIILAIGVWARRRRTGFAGSCIKCGRTFCPRCKSSRESATYCTQCIHIYLKRDGVSLDTKRTKLEEVHDYYGGMQTRNRIFATFVPGSAQTLEGRAVAGILGMFIFFLFVSIALTVGRLAPAIGPSAETAKLLVRVIAGALALVIWFLISFPVFRRRLVV
jgi:tetratricopeptide (TPR) repeat protein